MPNWVRNRVIAKDFAELKKHLVNEKGEVDFNVAIPMPQDLHIMSGSYSYEQQHRSWFSEFTAKRIKEQSPADVLMAQHYNDTITQEHFVGVCLLDKELVDTVRKIRGYKLRGEHKMSKENLREALETFFKGYFNVQRYGWKDWYDWSIDNWGTKWNASEGMVDDENQVIEFETAWSMPEGIIKEICKYTPIRIEYADEDLGANCGIEDYFVDEDGNPTYETVMSDSVELANECWGYGHMSVYDDEQQDWIEDEENPKFIEANKKYQAVVDEICVLMNPSTFDKDFIEV
jgi:hypothetical protein